MTATQPELVQGTLELLVLRTLTLAPMHGWGIAQRIHQLSHDTFLVQQGSLYPALQRMKRRGWVESSWRVTENNRRARYYEITRTGRAQVEVAHSEWRRAAAGIQALLLATVGAPEAA